MSRSQPARIEPRPPDAEWTEEDVLFVVADVLAAAPDDFGEQGFTLARISLNDSLQETRKIHTELGYPDGFDPHTYALIYARGAFGSLWYFTGELEGVEHQLAQAERLNRLLQMKLAALERRAR